MRVLDPNDPAEVLEAAADAMEVYGRCVCMPFDENGSVCVIGAIARAVDTEDIKSLDKHPALLAISEFLVDTQYETPWLRVATWNDRLAVGPANDALVTDSLRRCAKGIRSGEAQ